MPSMVSQYLIKQHLRTQPGSQDVHLSVHSTGWHTLRSLITCGDAAPHPQPAGATDRGYSTNTPAHHRRSVQYSYRRLNLGKQRN